MTVIVTDHHSLHVTDDNRIILPEADAIINPNSLIVHIRLRDYAVEQ